MKNIPIRKLGTAKQALSSIERFSIRRLQDIAGDNDLVHDLHRHDFFFILAVESGEGIHEIDFTRYPVVNNSIFIIRAGQVHRLQLKAGCTGYLLEFNNEFYHPKDKSFDQRLRKASDKQYCVPENNRFHKLKAILTSMYNEYTNREEGYGDMIKSCLDIFFIEFVRQSANQKGNTAVVNSYTQERLEEFSALVEKHITSHKQVSQYTAMMNLSPYQLNEITKSSVGKTASELINDHIILEAKRYLLATAGQVKDIADHLGYEDVSYFTRFFRKHTGYTPEAFRIKFP